MDSNLYTPNQKVFLYPSRQAETREPCYMCSVDCLKEVKPGFPREVYQVLQLFQSQEDEDSRRLETCPRGHPSLEHEHWAFLGHRLADDGESGLVCYRG